ncbi:retrovirus-related pol polyprotein from transposon TNT 1-94 [Tanacetum coccineum]
MDKRSPVNSSSWKSIQAIQTDTTLTDPEMVCRLLHPCVSDEREPKNIKEAMADSAWIEAMQEELHQFDRLQVWELHKVYRLRKALYGLKQAPRACMEKGQSIGTPMATKPKLDADLSGEPVDQTDYRSKIGSLMYLTSSRPDIVQAVCTIHMGLWYPKGSGFELTAFSDADHAGCLDTRKSTSGGIQFLGDKLVSWMSKKQDCTAMSSAEAEYVALSASCAQVMWMRTPSDSRLWLQLQQNTVVLRFSVSHSNFMQPRAALPTEYQLADMFTKALPEERFQYLVRQIGMRCLTPAELERLKLEAGNPVKELLDNLPITVQYFNTTVKNGPLTEPGGYIKMEKMIQVRLKETVRRIRTDNGTEFVNQTLREYYEKVGISHETSVARSPQQNGVVERRNRTLIEAARTMLIYAKAPLFLWAEADCPHPVITQNRSMIRRRHGPALHEMTPVSISSGLVPNPPSSTLFVPPIETPGFWFFQQCLMSHLVFPHKNCSPSSTTVIQDAPTPSNSHTTQETQTPIISHDVEEDNHDIEVAHMGNDPYFGIPIPEVPSDQSSSPVVIHTIVPPDHQVSEHNSKWTKDHPLENIIGALDRPVSTPL